MHLYYNYILNNMYVLLIGVNHPEIHLYRKAEKYCKIYFTSIFTAISIGIISISIRPLIIVLYNQYNGTYKPSHWIVPAPIRYVDDLM